MAGVINALRSALTSKPDVTWLIAMRSGKRKALNKDNDADTLIDKAEKPSSRPASVPKWSVRFVRLNTSLVASRCYLGLKKKTLAQCWGHGLLEGGVALVVDLVDMGMGEWLNHCCTLITLLSLNALGLLRGGLYGIAYATAAKTVSVVKHMQPPL